MKKTGLVVLIVICLIIFFSTLIAGSLLTIRTIGWSDLMDHTRLQERLTTILQKFRFLENYTGLSDTLSIDETRALDLTGIKTIEIAAVSENVRLNAAGEQATAQLKGSYRSWSSTLTWVVEKQGDVLKIHTKFPPLGLFNSDLQIFVQIPASFTGKVKVSTISGSCDLPDDVAYAWSHFEFSGISGSLSVARADMTAITCSSISGRLVLSQLTASVDGQTTSGAMALQYAAFRETNLKSISGSVRIVMPEQSNCAVDFSTVSGSFTNDGLSISIDKQGNRHFTGTIGDGSEKLTVHTTSGNLVMSNR